MYDHNKDKHNEHEMSTDDFQFEIITTFTDPMKRQIEEAVRIQRALDTGIHIDKNGKSHRI